MFVCVVTKQFVGIKILIKEAAVSSSGPKRRPAVGSGRADTD